MSTEELIFYPALIVWILALIILAVLILRDWWRMVEEPYE